MIPGATLSSYLWQVWWTTVRGSTTCLRGVRHTVATSYETCGPVPTDKAIRTQWRLLGVPVCVVDIAAIIGVTPHTLYKSVHQAVDLRKGPWSVQPHAAPQQRIVDQFFAELYMSAAEHLAEQDLDIGTVDDNITHDAALPNGAPVPV